MAPWKLLLPAVALGSILTGWQLTLPPAPDVLTSPRVCQSLGMLAFDQARARDIGMARAEARAAGRRNVTLTEAEMADEATRLFLAGTDASLALVYDRTDWGPAEARTEIERRCLGGMLRAASPRRYRLW